MRIRVRATLAALLSLTLFSEIAPAEPVLAAVRGATSAFRHEHLAVAYAVPPARIPVKEPLRVKRPLPSPPGRPHTVQAVSPRNPVRVAGPPMIAPRNLDAALRAANSRRLTPSAAATPLVRVSQPRVTHGTIVPGGLRRGQSLPSDPTASGTGINHWWRYEEQKLPGDGRMMVNVGTGNLVVQQDDMDVPHKGIAMTFRRTYNSQSPPTFSGDLASYTTMYGNGWTNTFDAHLVRTSPRHFSVFDIDGARYDYVMLDGNSISSSPGDHSQLHYDGQCGVTWTKKSGTIYYFYNSSQQTGCPQIGAMGGYAGRLYQIIGRNRNTYITFSYAWDNGDASVNGKISTITATTESGMAATLSFADVNGRRLLQSLTYPDGTTGVRYFYDANGNLGTVMRPPNNAAGTAPMVSFGYTTIGSDQILYNYSSPRWCQNATGCGYDGAWTLFLFNGTSAATSTFAEYSYAATVNPTINDGTNTSLYPGYAPDGLNYSTLRTEYYTTGVTTPTFRDTDGHMTNWVVDGSGRPTQTQECTASTNQGQQCTGNWLVSNEGWDANNDLVSEVNSRGFETDYAYDAMGNTVAEAASVTTTSAGTFRPTKLYDYDGNNNVVAYCDEKASHAGQGDWTASGPPAAGGPDALCANNGAAAHTIFTFATPSPQPYGELTGIRTPLGYNHTIGYDPSRQGGLDYGLPTSVAGDPIAQSDGTRTPLQTMAYDANGNLICSATDGNDSTTMTILAYDSLNRVVTVADPDDGSVTNASCAKTAGIPGSAIVTRMTYFPNGQIATTQTPAEAAANVSSQFQYDLDGNVTSEQKHYTSTAGPTTKWYDGADRLVEVQQPTDPTDFYGFPWQTRYLYDLSKSGTVSVGASAPFRAYGGLYKTQERLPSGVVNAVWNEAGSQNGPSVGTGNPSWQDTAGTAFDALDRSVAAYRNTGTSLMTDTNTYDAAGEAGLLSQACNANNECRTFAYDARGAKVQTTFSVSSTTTQTFSYDEDGRLASGVNGVGSITDAYDGDGRKTSRQENVGGVNASLNYAYYGDGLRKSVDIAAGSQSIPAVLAYTYRNDGLIRNITVAGSQWFNFSYTGGRRLTSRSDNTGQPALSYSYTGSSSPSSYGLVQSIAGPAFNEGGITYNPEGGQLWEGSFTAYNGTGWYTAGGPNNTYSSRGELAQGALFANGMRIQTGRSSSAASPKTASFSFNVFQGRTMSTESANTCISSCVENDSGWSFGYDAGGRQTSAGFTSQSNGYTNGKSYDADDHLTFQDLWIPFRDGAVEQYLGYQWGALGHPLQIGSTAVITSSGAGPFQYDTLGWDDDTVLFTVNPAGQIDDVKIGDFADYVPGSTNSLTVWDRDMNDQVLGCHNAGGAAAGGSGAFQRPTAGCAVSNTTVSFVGPGFSATTNRAVGRGGMLVIAKGDGFSDGQNTFQGVRTFDPQAGTWTTPDAFRGDVHDPMSQKAYAWNRNNPYQYSDPSGYAGDDNRTGLPNAIAAVIAKLIGRPGYIKNELSAIRRALGVPESAPSIRADARHIFRPAHNMADTSVNRVLLQATVTRGTRVAVTEMRGPVAGTVERYAAKMPSGAEVWAEVTNGEITNGGINTTPLYSGLNLPDVFLPQQFTGEMNGVLNPPMIQPPRPL